MKKFSITTVSLAAVLAVTVAIPVGVKMRSSVERREEFLEGPGTRPSDSMFSKSRQKVRLSHFAQRPLFPAVGPDPPKEVPEKALRDRFHQLTPLIKRIPDGVYPIPFTAIREYLRERSKLAVRAYIAATNRRQREFAEERRI